VSHVSRLYVLIRNLLLFVFSIPCVKLFCIFVSVCQKLIFLVCLTYFCVKRSHSPTVFNSDCCRKNGKFLSATFHVAHSEVFSDVLKFTKRGYSGSHRNRTTHRLGWRTVFCVSRNQLLCASSPVKLFFQGSASRLLQLFSSKLLQWYYGEDPTRGGGCDEHCLRGIEVPRSRQQFSVWQPSWKCWGETIFPVPRNTSFFQLPGPFHIGQ